MRKEVLEGMRNCVCGSGKKTDVEKLWRKFFSDPSQWWDHRSEKVNVRYPDFKHKRTQEGLWLDSKLNPQWVEADLAAMPPGAVQWNIFSWNRRLARLTKAAQYEETMGLYRQMQQEGMIPDRLTFIPVLNACAGLQLLEEGRCIHTKVIQSGCQSDIYVSSSLVDMYAKCGAIDDAWEVFNQMATHDVVAWNAMILGYVKCGQGQKALELFRQMQQEGVEPVPVTFVGLLNACASLMALEQGRQVHEQVIQSGYESDVFVGSSLVDMYAKCKSLDRAWRVFNKISKFDEVPWNAMIVGHVRCGQAQKALELFQQMHQEGVKPDRITFVGVLNACASLGALQEGRRVHEEITQKGCQFDVFVGNSLVDMYAKCGSIEDAMGVFNNIPCRDVVSWNAVILGHVKCGQGQKALELFQQMQQEGLNPGPMTFVAVLNACASLGVLEEGKHIHEQIIQRACESDIYVGSSLVDMYMKCGSIEHAWRVFKKMPKRDVVAWNAMILGCVKYGQGYDALELSRQMGQEGVEPVYVTFVAILNACASVGALEEGRRVHEQIIQKGCQSDVFVGSSLIDMYAKCGSIGDASRVFSEMPVRSVVSWNAMILGYVKCGHGQKALDLFQQMRGKGVDPVPVTFVGVINACASVGALEEGKRVNELITDWGCECDVFVGSSLVNMYSKCGSIEDAWRVFDKMPTRNVVSWNAIILGYARCGKGQKALELFQSMQEESVEPDRLTYVGMLNACVSLVALDEGRRIHEQIIEKGYESDVFVGSTLVDMYSKCGSLDDAWKQFNKMPTHDVVSWNAMLGGYAMHGCAMKALAHFERMCQDGIGMDAVTFVSLLSACSHAGMVDEGLYYFESMSSVHSICTTLEHYACIVDILGRAGRLHEADDIIQMIACKPDASVWLSLLGACKVHGNVEIGERVAEEVLKLEPVDAAGYVLLSNIYAAAGKWDSHADIQQQKFGTG